VVVATQTMKTMAVGNFVKTLVEGVYGGSFRVKNTCEDNDEH